MSFQCQIKENHNKLIPISYILRIIIILNRKASTAQLTPLEVKMLNDVMLHTKLEEWKNNWIIFHIQIFTQIIKGINNSVLYIDYLLNVNNKVIPYCVSFTTVPKHLHSLTQQSNVLHINGKGQAFAKENKDLYQFGLQGWPLQ